MKTLMLFAFKLAEVASFASPQARQSIHHFAKISMSAMSTDTSSWSGLQTAAAKTAVGAALISEQESRARGTGAPFVHNKLRLFESTERPMLTLYRDHAGWCPYCQKTMLLIEEKQIPINIELVPMRSYGDKPESFLRIVPSGLLPALLVEKNDGKKQVITESQVIMEFLDLLHPVDEGFRRMLPAENDQARYKRLANLERELFSWWCTLIFRPEGPGFSSGGMIGKIMGSNDSSMSGAMKGFLDCLSQVDDELASTSGPWFFDFASHPTMIDFVYVSHVERMLASCAFWKGLDLRSDNYRRQFPALNAWLDAFEKRECYLAFKSDYYTHVMDIPPQYGPGYDGGFKDNRLSFQKSITGQDAKSWNLPLPFDDPLQPLYRGPPLPLCVLKAAEIKGDNGIVGAEGTSYEKADHEKMAEACRQMAGWKLSGNGQNVSICRRPVCQSFQPPKQNDVSDKKMLWLFKVAKFASRGGPQGSKNPRKGFGAELADPYAAPDEALIPHVDLALKLVCGALLAEGPAAHETAVKDMKAGLEERIDKSKAKGVASALCYLRDRTGVPRDLPLAAARQLRAHLNVAIDVLR
jgi:glutathione S-transferase